MLLLVLVMSFALSRASVTAPATFFVRATFDLSPPNNTVTFKITRAWAPLGADRFYELLTLPDGSYYANNAMFRVLPGFVDQFGIAGSPALSQYWDARPIPDDPVVQSNVAGTLTFATGGPNTRTTQLFVNLANNSRLDAMGFAPFGALTQPASDLAVLSRLYAGYGEQVSNAQGTILAKGNTWLKANYPLLNYLLTTEVVPSP